MKNIISKINHLCESECEKYRLPYSLVIIILYLPLLIILLYALSIILPQTQTAAVSMIRENNIVEQLTFVSLLIGSLQGLYLAWWTKVKKKELFVWSFYALFSLGLLLIAMEEISWGQQIFKFQTPDFIKAINDQEEFTIHNIKGLQGNSEFFHVSFGIGGLVGVWLNSRLRLREIGVPFMLLTWFLAITVVSGIDLYNDFFPIEKNFDQGMRWMSEIIEMLIGFAGFLYVWLITRKLKGKQ